MPGQRSVNDLHMGTGTAPTCAMFTATITDYQKKVREIAVAQCRCETGADLVVEKAKDDHAPEEHPKAA